MARYVREKLPKLRAAESGALEAMIQAVVAEADLPADRSAPGPAAEARKTLVEAGSRHVSTTFGCTDCHAFRKPDEEATAPTLTGWGSRDWMIRLVGDPTHPDFYGQRNDRMPSYLKEGRLSERDIGYIVDWIRQDTAPARSLNSAALRSPR